MQTRILLASSLVVLLSYTMLRGETPALWVDGELEVAPAEVHLSGPLGRQQVVISATRDGRTVDVTTQVAFRSEVPGIAEVNGRGVVVPKSDGTTLVEAQLGQARVAFAVHVDGTSRPVEVGFERDIMPILTRASCNSGACHGKARGQNGFQLSLLGFDPDSDLDAIAHEARGRRVFPAAPDHSLILLKATARQPHGGGPKLDVESTSYRVLREWIARGMPRDPVGSPELEGIAVTPVDRVMAPAETQQMVVTARYADGSEVDVTHLAAFQSSESVVVGVDEHGLIRAGELPGEAAITARFEGNFASCLVTIPLAGTVSPGTYASLPRSNFVDDHVWTKLEKLGITPSDLADDATFLRRAHLDVIGRMPTPEEVRTFLADPSPSKRSSGRRRKS